MPQTRPARLRLGILETHHQLMWNRVWSTLGYTGAQTAPAAASQVAGRRQVLGVGGSAASAAVVAAGPPTWAFADGAQGWQPYEASTQQLLEAAHARGDLTASFSFGRWSYTVHLQGSLVQTNTRTGMTRAVQRNCHPGARSSPAPAPTRSARTTAASDAVAQLVGFTGCSEKQAHACLEAAGGDQQRAASMLLS